LDHQVKKNKVAFIRNPFFIGVRRLARAVGRLRRV